MEDVAEKARRNLMMVSAGILAVSALGIPLDGKLVGAVDLNAVEPWRAWAVALAVLTYFGLRHYFAPDTHKAWIDWATRRKSWFITARSILLDQCLPHRTAVTNAQTIFIDHRMTFDDPKLPADCAWVLVSNQNIIWKGRSGATDTLWDKSEKGRRVITLRSRGADHKSRVEFTIRRRTYVRLVLESWAQAYRPSWRLLELSFPWLLAFGAAIVCVCKLVASVYYSFPFIRQLLPA